MLSNEQLEEKAEELRAIEDATADAVTEILGPIIRTLIATAVALWPGDDATREAQQRALKRLNTRVLQPPMAQVRARIKSGAREALTAGLSVALEEAEEAGVDVPDVDDLPPRVTHLSPILHARVDALEAVMRSKLLKTDVLIKHSMTMTDVLESLAVAKQGLNVAVMVARTTTNEASNEAITAVAREVDDLVSVWRSERDACLHCLAYQGQIDTGDGYPEGRTFGKTALDTGPVSGPPLHPNCRCTQSLVHKDAASPLAKALEREAKRSVLRGWSLESESEKSRLDAAKRLVDRGTTLPKSVQEYARRSVKSGGFGRGRRPPT